MKHLVRRNWSVTTTLDTIRATWIIMASFPRLPKKFPDFSGEWEPCLSTDFEGEILTTQNLDKLTYILTLPVYVIGANEIKHEVSTQI